MEPNDEILKALDEIVDVNLEEVGRRKLGKRSSILKQPRFDDDQTEDPLKRKSLVSKRRVSFADKFQVMELCTGNIYDIPGRSVSASDSTLTGDVKSISEPETSNVVASIYISRSEMKTSVTTEQILADNERNSISKKHKISSNENNEPDNKRRNTTEKSSSPVNQEENLFKNEENLMSEFKKFLFGNTDIINKEKYKNMESTNLKNTDVNLFGVNDDMQQKDFRDLDLTNPKILSLNKSDKLTMPESEKLLVNYKFASTVKHMINNCNLEEEFILKNKNCLGLENQNIDNFLTDASKVEILHIPLSEVPIEENKENILIDVKNKKMLVTNARDLKSKRTLPLKVSQASKPLSRNFQVDKENFMSVNKMLQSSEYFNPLLVNEQGSICKQNRRENVNKTCILNNSMELTCFPSDSSNEVEQLTNNNNFELDRNQTNKTRMDASHFMDLTCNEQNLISYSPSFSDFNEKNQCMTNIPKEPNENSFDEDAMQITCNVRTLSDSLLSTSEKNMEELNVQHIASNSDKEKENVDLFDKDSEQKKNLSCRMPLTYAVKSKTNLKICNEVGEQNPSLESESIKISNFGNTVRNFDESATKHEKISQNSFINTSDKNIIAVESEKENFNSKQDHEKTLFACDEMELTCYDKNISLDGISDVESPKNAEAPKDELCEENYENNQVNVDFRHDSKNIEPNASFVKLNPNRDQIEFGISPNSALISREASKTVFFTSDHMELTSKTYPEETEYRKNSSVKSFTKTKHFSSLEMDLTCDFVSDVDSSNVKRQALSQSEIPNKANNCFDNENQFANHQPSEFMHEDCNLSEKQVDHIQNEKVTSDLPIVHSNDHLRSHFNGKFHQLTSDFMDLNSKTCLADEENSKNIHAKTFSKTKYFSSVDMDLTCNIPSEEQCMFDSQQIINKNYSNDIVQNKNNSNISKKLCLTNNEKHFMCKSLHSFNEHYNSSINATHQFTKLPSNTDFIEDEKSDDVDYVSKLSKTKKFSSVDMDLTCNLSSNTKRPCLSESEVFVDKSKQSNGIQNISKISSDSSKNVNAVNMENQFLHFFKPEFPSNEHCNTAMNKSAHFITSYPKSSSETCLSKNNKNPNSAPSFCSTKYFSSYGMEFTCNLQNDSQLGPMLNCSSDSVFITSPLPDRDNEPYSNATRLNKYVYGQNIEKCELKEQSKCRESNFINTNLDIPMVDKLDSMSEVLSKSSNLCPKQSITAVKDINKDLQTKNIDVPNLSVSFETSDLLRNVSNTEQNLKSVKRPSISDKDHESNKKIMKVLSKSSNLCLKQSITAVEDINKDLQTKNIDVPNLSVSFETSDLLINMSNTEQNLKSVKRRSISDNDHESNKKIMKVLSKSSNLCPKQSITAVEDINKDLQTKNIDVPNLSISFETSDLLRNVSNTEQNLKSLKRRSISDKDHESDKKIMKYSDFLEPGIVYAIKQVKGANQALPTEYNVFKFPEFFFPLKKYLKPKTSFSCSKIQLTKAVQEAIRKSCSFSYAPTDWSHEFSENDSPSKIKQTVYLRKTPTKEDEKSSTPSLKSTMLPDAPCNSRVFETWKSTTKTVTETVHIYPDLQFSKINSTPKTNTSVNKNSSFVKESFSILNQSPDTVNCLRRNSDFENKMNPSAIIISQVHEESIVENTAIITSTIEDSYHDVSKLILDTSISLLPNDTFSSMSLKLHSKTFNELNSSKCANVKDVDDFNSTDVAIKTFTISNTRSSKEYIPQAQITDEKHKFNDGITSSSATPKCNKKEQNSLPDRCNLTLSNQKYINELIDDVKNFPNEGTENNRCNIKSPYIFDKKADIQNCSQMTKEKQKASKLKESVKLDLSKTEDAVDKSNHTSNNESNQIFTRVLNKLEIESTTQDKFQQCDSTKFSDKVITNINRIHEDDSNDIIRNTSHNLRTQDEQILSLSNNIKHCLNRKENDSIIDNTKEKQNDLKENYETSSLNPSLDSAKQNITSPMISKNNKSLNKLNKNLSQKVNDSIIDKTKEKQNDLKENYVPSSLNPSIDSARQNITSPMISKIIKSPNKLNENEMNSINSAVHLTGNSSVIDQVDLTNKDTNRNDVNMEDSALVLGDSLKKNISFENPYEKIHVLRKQLLKKSNSENCLWNLMEMDDKEAVFEILRESMFACYLMCVDLDFTSEIALCTKVAFMHLKEDPDEMDELGFSLFQSLVADDVKILPFPAHELLDKLTKFVDFALFAKCLIKDVWLVAIRNEISIDDSAETPILSIKVLNENHFSYFNIMLPICLKSYPGEKIIPEVVHLEHNLIKSEIIVDAIRKIEPGKNYLFRISKAAHAL